MAAATTSYYRPHLQRHTRDESVSLQPAKATHSRQTSAARGGTAHTTPGIYMYGSRNNHPTAEGNYMKTHNVRVGSPAEVYPSTLAHLRSQQAAEKRAPSPHVHTNHTAVPASSALIDDLATRATAPAITTHGQQTHYAPLPSAIVPAPHYQAATRAAGAVVAPTAVVPPYAVSAPMASVAATARQLTDREVDRAVLRSAHAAERERRAHDGYTRKRMQQDGMDAARRSYPQPNVRAYSDANQQQYDGRLVTSVFEDGLAEYDRPTLVQPQLEQTTTRHSYPYGQHQYEAAAALPSQDALRDAYMDDRALVAPERSAAGTWQTEYQRTFVDWKRAQRDQRAAWVATAQDSHAYDRNNTGAAGLAAGVPSATTTQHHYQPDRIFPSTAQTYQQHTVHRAVNVSQDSGLLKQAARRYAWAVEDPTYLASLPPAGLPSASASASRVDLVDMAGHKRQYPEHRDKIWQVMNTLSLEDEVATSRAAGVGKLVHTDPALATAYRPATPPTNRLNGHRELDPLIPANLTFRPPEQQYQHAPVDTTPVNPSVYTRAVPAPSYLQQQSLVPTTTATATHTAVAAPPQAQTYTYAPMVQPERVTSSTTVPTTTTTTHPITESLDNAARTWSASLRDYRDGDAHHHYSHNHLPRPSSSASRRSYSRQSNGSSVGGTGANHHHHQQQQQQVHRPPLSVSRGRK
ncbi:hypothetical protein RI367_008000 [Sorochytrium milnesiophthora]